LTAKAFIKKWVNTANANKNKKIDTTSGGENEK